MLRAESDTRAVAAARDAYDKTPYPGAAQIHTHPDTLATLALLHGMRPAPPEGCRVLELGCSDAGNLIPMAFDFPDSRFTGIDVSPRQIETGRQTAAALDIGNLDLQALSLTEIGPDFGQFDYIIAHGVYSWVPAWVQAHLMRICAENLAPQGVAYISYNTLPGWHLRGMVREMMLYHARHESDPRRRGEKAVELMDFLGQATAEEQDAYALALRQVRQHLSDYHGHSHYLIHEYLEDDNQPLYFHEFVRRAGEVGLQYLADAGGRAAGVANLRPEVRDSIRRFGDDRLDQEQYVDFISNRMFRGSLLCHRAVDLDTAVDPALLQGMHAGANVRHEGGEVDLTRDTPETFFGADEQRFAVTHPPAKAVLALLGQAWPATLPVKDLQAAVRDCFQPDPPGEQALAEVLLSAYFAGIVDLHQVSPGCVNRAGGRPQASPLARRQIRQGPRVVNRRHRTLSLDDPMVGLLLAHLDGQHDRAALIQVLAREVRAGRFKLSYEDKPIEDPRLLDAVLGHMVDEQLQHMADNALLVG